MKNLCLFLAVKFSKMASESFFKGKVVVITGASSGIGLGFAQVLGKSGAKLALAARSLDKLEQIRSEIVGLGGQAVCVQTDVSIESDCKRLVDETVAAYGGIDILINNAGISMRAAFADIDLNVIRQVVDINFWGTVYCTKYAYPWILKSKGTIVGISSITGFTGLPGRTGYAASKFAMHGFLETLRMENLKTGVHVLIVAPGFTASNVRINALTKDGTPQGNTPREEKKMMPPEEVALRTLKAIRKRKRTLILSAMGKATFIVNKFFPAFIDRMSYREMAKEPDSPFKL